MREDEKAPPDLGQRADLIFGHDGRRLGLRHFDRQRRDGDADGLAHAGNEQPEVERRIGAHGKRDVLLGAAETGQFGNDSVRRRLKSDGTVLAASRQRSRLLRERGC